MAPHDHLCVLPPLDAPDQHMLVQSQQSVPSPPLLAHDTGCGGTLPSLPQQNGLESAHVMAAAYCGTQPPVRKVALGLNGAIMPAGTKYACPLVHTSGPTL